MDCATSSSKVKVLAVVVVVMDGGLTYAQQAVLPTITQGERVKAAAVLKSSALKIRNCELETTI